MKNFVLFLIATVFALLCAEGLLRILQPPKAKAINYRVDTVAGSYSLPIPGAERVILGRPVSINKLGYRGHPYPPERTDGTFRIQVFGDSFTFGSGASNDQSYPAIMEQTLNRQRDGYEVLNFGVGGHDFGEIANHMSSNVPKYDPDLVIVTFHAGDIISTDIIIEGRAVENKPLLVRIQYKLMSSSYFAQLLITYGHEGFRSVLGKQLSGETIQETKEIESDGPRWKIFRTEILRLKSDLLDQCTGLVVVLFPSMIDFERTQAIELHALLSSWLLSNDISFIDLLPAYQNSGRKASKLWATLLDHHPNEEGYAIAGEAVAEFVGPISQAKTLGTSEVCQNNFAVAVQKEASQERD